MKTAVSRRRSPKKLTAIQTSRHLQLSRHKHTGHILPRRSTSYPMLVMIVLSVGVLLVGYTRYVTADTLSANYVVHASVPGPAPTQPAIIEAPENAAVTTSQPMNIGGSCPVNTYVSLFRNNYFSGVALCDATGQWSLSTGLFPGANRLQAVVHNFTDVPGPPSSTIIVYYNPPSNTTQQGAGSSQSTNNSQPSNTSQAQIAVSPDALILKADYLYQGVYTGDPLNWQVSVEGGSAPYSFAVDWGDGQSSLFTRSEKGAFGLSHTYKKAGGFHGSYPVKIVVSDASGNQTLLQLLAIVNNHPQTGGALSLNGDSNSGIFSGSGIQHNLKYIWPTYGVVVLMLSSFWLGERQEFHQLRGRYKKLRHS